MEGRARNQTQFLLTLKFKFLTLYHLPPRRLSGGQVLETGEEKKVARDKTVLPAMV